MIRISPSRFLHANRARGYRCIDPGRSFQRSCSSSGSPHPRSRSGGPPAVFRRVDGIVDAVDDERIRFTTRDGATLVLDRSQIVGERPRVAPNETATLIYEQEPRVAGVWIETREVEPAAAPR